MLKEDIRNDRGFMVVERCKEMDVTLPTRGTSHSAGYDFIAFEDVDIPVHHIGDKPIMVKTGIKAFMPTDEFLLIANRSSNPSKKNLIVANGVGIIDSDYFSNKDNDGEIAFPFYNNGRGVVHIKKGDKLGQGIFLKFGIASNGYANESNATREGGFGSTGK